MNDLINIILGLTAVYISLRVLKWCIIVLDKNVVEIKRQREDKE